MDQRSTTAYGALLHEAHELGLADGRFAVDFEPAGGQVESRGRCLGRTPEQFARLLWEDRPGEPPAGLVANAPLWYATGFQRALAEHRARRTAVVALVVAPVE